MRNVSFAAKAFVPALFALTVAAFTAGVPTTGNAQSLGLGCRGVDKLETIGNKIVCVSVTNVQCTFGDRVTDQAGSVDKCVKVRNNGTQVIRDTRCGVFTDKKIVRSGTDQCRNEYLPLPRA